MNYKQKAREIREQRFAMWEELGKPAPLIRMIKGRQCGHTPPISLLRYTPWSDQWNYAMMLEWAYRMWFGTYGPERRMTTGLLDVIRNS